MFNRSLLLNEEKEQGYFFKFNTDDVLKSTQEERYNALKTGIDAGILSLSEARVKENLSPIEDDFLKLSLGSILFGDHRLDNEMNNPNNNEPKPVTTDEGDKE